MAAPDETGEGTGETGQVSGDTLETLRTQLAEVQEKVKASDTREQELQGKLSAADEALMSGDYLAFLEQKQAGAAQTGQPQASVKEEVDYDTLTNAQLVEMLKREHVDALKTLNDSHAKERTSDIGNIAKVLATIDFELTKLRHVGGPGKPGLADKFTDDAYKKRFYSVSQANPTWDAERVYKETERELRDEREEKQEASREKAAQQLRALTEREGVSPSTVSDKDLTEQEAGELGYRKSGLGQSLKSE